MPAQRGEIEMRRTIENMLTMRDLAAVAVAGCFLTIGTPAQACSGPLKPNFMAGMVPNMAVAAGLIKPPGTTLSDGSLVHENDQAPAAHIPSIVGLWQTSYLSNKVVVDQGFEQWHSDGSEILIDTAPPATDNVCIGTWVQTGTYSYSLTHPSWTFDMAGNLTGTALILNSVTLSHDGEKFTGSFTIKTFDVNGVLTGTFEGQLSAVRIKPM
jgi:hypothetical protein